MRNDPNRLKQILSKLLSNALKFTKYGFIKISYEEIENIKPCLFSQVLLRVEDSGSGIEREKLPNLLKLFAKLEDFEAQDFNTNGFGFGLTICNNILRVMNPSLDFSDGPMINIHSVVGEGSCFSFSLSSVLEKESDSQETLNNLVFAEEDLHMGSVFKSHLNDYTLTIHSNKSSSIEKSLVVKKKLLLVEDDPINQLVAKNYLKNIPGLEKDFVENGLQALNIVKDNFHKDVFYDIILMDCNMPVMDGFQATLELRTLIKRKLIPDVPIIAVTANVNPSDIEKCFRCGMNDCLKKPFTADQLKKMIYKYVSFGSGD